MDGGVEGVQIHFGQGAGKLAIICPESQSWCSKGRRTDLPVSEYKSTTSNRLLSSSIAGMNEPRWMPLRYKSSGRRLGGVSVSIQSNEGRPTWRS